MPGQYHGGIKSLAEYFMDKDPSPCAECSRLTQDKNLCAERCSALVTWQVKTDALSKPSKIKAIKRIMRDGAKICLICGGRLRYDDGVIYCRLCMKIHMRLENKDSVEEVGYLLYRGWHVDQIADVMNLCREHTMSLAKQNGVGFQQWATEEEKAYIVDYMLEHGSAEAAQKFDLHPGTINRYARQFDLGTKERYERLKIRAQELFEDGAAVVDVADKLGIDRKTARVWMVKMGN